jgi:hypothetical protein
MIGALCFRLPCELGPAIECIRPFPSFHFLEGLDQRIAFRFSKPRKRRLTSAL